MCIPVSCCKHVLSGLPCILLLSLNPFFLYWRQCYLPLYLYLSSPLYSIHFQFHQTITFSPQVKDTLTPPSFASVATGQSHDSPAFLHLLGRTPLLLDQDEIGVSHCRAAFLYCHQTGNGKTVFFCQHCQERLKYLLLQVIAKVKYWGMCYWDNLQLFNALSLDKLNTNQKEAIIKALWEAA